MAQTIAFGKIPGVNGPGFKIAVGTVSGIHDAGTFFVRQGGQAGSQVMRNVQVIFMTNLGTESVMVTAQGSSSGAITTKTTHIGSLTGETRVVVNAGTLDCHFIAIGGNTVGGSLPA